MSEPGLGAALSLSVARRLALSCAGSELAAASPGVVRGPNWLWVPPLCNLEAAELDLGRRDLGRTRSGEHCPVPAPAQAILVLKRSCAPPPTLCLERWPKPGQLVPMVSGSEVSLQIRLQ